jgi:arylsulfatase
VPDSLEENLAQIDELGGPSTFNHYAWGWTFAGNTPFRRWKRETYRGGISDPFIVHWPRGISASGGVRTQYGHAIDMVPTVLEALGLEPPTSIRGVAQAPIEGVSLAQTFHDEHAPTTHLTQYYEMMGHRSIYHDGWKAVCPWPGPSFTEAGKPFGQPIDSAGLVQLDATGWELYNLQDDFAENHDLASEHPDKLQEMIGIWYAEAAKYKVLPIDARGQMRFADPRPQIAEGRERYTYYPGTQTIPINAGPVVLNRTYTITADVETGSAGAQGVLLSAGDVQGGFTFFVQGSKLQYVYSYVGSDSFHVESDVEVPTGRHELRVEFEVTGPPDFAVGRGAPGQAQLYIDGALTGAVDVPLTMPLSMGLGAGFTCGADAGSPVTDRYRPPFAFDGTLHSVTIDVSGEVIEDGEARLRAVMARQ